ncbi:density-regulated protein [Acomys russatus]|uniref:density-regulated protein n=1 Tax=Acomys russatus TaxID=60746 RepID=UPI0021E321A0|nr:density-regulated protein [Acomys russatus]
MRQVVTTCCSQEAEGDEFESTLTFLLARRLQPIERSCPHLGRDFRFQLLLSENVPRPTLRYIQKCVPALDDGKCSEVDSEDESQQVVKEDTEMRGVLILFVWLYGSQCGFFMWPCRVSAHLYCEYMPDVAKCRQWLEKNFPHEFAKLTVGTDFGSEEEEGIIEENENEAEGKNQENSPKQEAGISEGQGPVGEEEEKKKQKRGGRGQIKQKKKTVPQKVTIAKIPRAKKKYVTRVCGLATFEIDLKEAQRFFAQKFSCGASVTGEDEIIIQGDFTDDIIDVIQEKWPEVDDDSIEDLGEVKK